MDVPTRARKMWGTDAEYFKELERFHKEHEGATCIEYDSITDMPVKATYVFQPFTVFREHLDLVEKIQKANKDASDE